MVSVILVCLIHHKWSMCACAGGRSSGLREGRRGRGVFGDFGFSDGFGEGFGFSSFGRYVIKYITSSIFVYTMHFGQFCVYCVHIGAALQDIHINLLVMLQFYLQLIWWQWWIYDQFLNINQDSQWENCHYQEVRGIYNTMGPL